MGSNKEGRIEDIFDDIESLGKEIQRAEKELNQKVGYLEAAKDQQQKQFGVSTVDEAKNLKEEKIKEKQKFTEELNALYKRMREEFEW